MKLKSFLTTFLLAVAVNCSAQQVNGWEPWSWLIGDWIGEGSGQPGQGSGTFSFHFDLDKNIIIRKSHSTYPAANNKPEIVHDDLMIIFHDNSGKQDKAVYFDNEGHTIMYSVFLSEKSISLTSEKSVDSPVFRLIYTRLDDETVNTQFSISQDGVKFMPYIEGKSKRSKSAQ